MVQPGDCSLPYHDVVQRLIAGDHRFAAAHFAMHHGADINSARALKNALERGVEIFERDFGEKSQRAKIYSYDWNASRSDGAGGGEQGAVTAEHDDELQLTRSHLHA